MYNPFKEVKITNKGKTLQFLIDIEEFYFTVNQVVIIDSSQYGKINPENYGSQMAFALSQSSQYWHDLGGGGVYVEIPIKEITDNSKVKNTGMFILTVFLEAVHPDVESYNIHTATFNLEFIYNEAIYLVKKASAKCSINSKEELLDLY